MSVYHTEYMDRFIGKTGVIDGDNSESDSAKILEFNDFGVVFKTDENSLCFVPYNRLNHIQLD